MEEANAQNALDRPPSRICWFGFSMKVYRDRPRGHNEPYVPDIEYRGDHWDTETLRTWVLETAR